MVRHLNHFYVKKTVMSAFIVSLDDFRSRHASFVKDEVIEQKYNALISKYECFSKVIYYHKGSAVRPNDKPRKAVVSRNENETYSRRTVKKSFTSLWNTLNESNYHKISHKLKFMVTNENAVTVVRELLTMCIVHSIYRHLFLLLVNDVIRLCPGKSVESLHEHVASFDVAYFVLPTDIDMITPSYEVFCKMQKHKLKCIQTVHLMFDLTKNVPESGVTQACVWDRVKLALESRQDNEYYMDIFLSCMFVIIEKVTDRLILDDVKTSVSKVSVPTHMSMKVVFMLEKIRNALGMKN